MESGRNVKGKVIMPKSKGIELKKFEKVSAGGTVAKEVEQKGIYPAQLGIRVSRGKARKQSCDLSSSRTLPGTSDGTGENPMKSNDRVFIRLLDNVTHENGGKNKAQC